MEKLGHRYLESSAFKLSKLGHAALEKATWRNWWPKIPKIWNLGYLFIFIKNIKVKSLIDGLEKHKTFALNDFLPRELS